VHGRPCSASRDTTNADFVDDLTRVQACNLPPCELIQEKENASKYSLLSRSLLASAAFVLPANRRPLWGCWSTAYATHSAIDRDAGALHLEVRRIAAGERGKWRTRSLWPPAPSPGRSEPETVEAESGFGQVGFG